MNTWGHRPIFAVAQLVLACAVLVCFLVAVLRLWRGTASEAGDGAPPGFRVLSAQLGLQSMAAEALLWSGLYLALPLLLWGYLMGGVDLGTRAWNGLLFVGAAGSWGGAIYVVSIANGVRIGLGLAAMAIMVNFLVLFVWTARSGTVAAVVELVQGGDRSWLKILEGRTWKPPRFPWALAIAGTALLGPLLEVHAISLLPGGAPAASGGAWLHVSRRLPSLALSLVFLLGLPGLIRFTQMRLMARLGRGGSAPQQEDESE